MVKVARGKALVAKLRADPEVRDAEALAAYLGRKKKLKQAAKKAKKIVKKAGDAKSSSKPSRTTKEQVNSKPWEFSPLQYQLAHGVDQPFIGEISGVQHSRLSKRGKAQYEAKRRADWQASADAKNEWAERVQKAYEDGSITKNTPGLSEDAKNAIIRIDISKKAAKERAGQEAKQKDNLISSLDQLEKGQILYSNMYGAVGVVRVSPKSTRVQLLDANGNPRKNRDGSPATINISARLLKAGALQRKQNI